MGVCGSGKSTVGAAIALNLDATFLEGDEFHPPANVARMAAGIALTDDDRQGWLQTLGAQLGAARREGRASCCRAPHSSAATATRCAGRRSDLALVYLAGTPELLAQRMAGRSGHYMPPSLLASQLATLEPPQADEHALTLDIARAPQAIVQDALAWLGHPHAT